MSDVGVSETNRPSKTHDAARRRRDGGVREDERDENARNALEGTRSVRDARAMRESWNEDDDAKVSYTQPRDFSDTRRRVRAGRINPHLVRTE